MLPANPLDVLGGQADDERGPVEVGRLHLATAVCRRRDADGLEAGARAPAHRQPVDRQRARRDDLDVGEVGGEHGAGDHRACGVAGAQDEDHVAVTSSACRYAQRSHDGDRDHDHRRRPRHAPHVGARRSTRPAPPPDRGGLPADRDPRARQRDHRARRAVGTGRAAVRGGRRAAPARPRPRRGHPAPRHRHGRRRRAAERDPDAGRPARRPWTPGATEVGRAEALHRHDRRERHHVRHRAGGDRQVVARRGDGRQGAAGQGGPADHPDSPGGRGRRAARLPARAI